MLKYENYITFYLEDEGSNCVKVHAFDDFALQLIEELKNGMVKYFECSPNNVRRVTPENVFIKSKFEIALNEKNCKVMDYDSDGYEVRVLPKLNELGFYYLKYVDLAVVVKSVSFIPIGVQFLCMLECTDETETIVKIQTYQCDDTFDEKLPRLALLSNMLVENLEGNVYLNNLAFGSIDFVESDQVRPSLSKWFRRYLKKSVPSVEPVIDVEEVENRVSGKFSFLFIYLF